MLLYTDIYVYYTERKNLVGKMQSCRDKLFTDTKHQKQIQSRYLNYWKIQLITSYEFYGENKCTVQVILVKKISLVYHIPGSLESPTEQKQ